MLRGLLDRLRTPDESVQFEVQRMTANGGWVNFYEEFSESDETAAFDTPPDPPSFDENSAYPPGKYRCIERRDGRISETRWTVESPDTAEFYERQRQRDRQREKLDEFSYDELVDALVDDDPFPALDRSEVREAMEEKREQANQSQDSDSPESPIAQHLSKLVRNDDLDDETLNRVRDIVDMKVQLESARNGLCYRCQSNDDVRRCASCGELVCATHRTERSGTCQRCHETADE